MSKRETWHKWKFEGKVVSELGRTPEALAIIKNTVDHTVLRPLMYSSQAKARVLATLKDWKSRGITTVEDFVSDEELQTAIKFFATIGITIKVIRGNSQEGYFCQFSL